MSCLEVGSSESYICLFFSSSISAFTGTIKLAFIRLFQLIEKVTCLAKLFSNKYIYASLRRFIIINSCGGFAIKYLMCNSLVWVMDEERLNIISTYSL